MARLNFRQILDLKEIFATFFPLELQHFLSSILALYGCNLMHRIVHLKSLLFLEIHLFYIKSDIVYIQFVSSLCKLVNFHVNKSFIT